jgi:hypothetical protein
MRGPFHATAAACAARVAGPLALEGRRALDARSDWDSNSRTAVDCAHDQEIEGES